MSQTRAAAIFCVFVLGAAAGLRAAAPPLPPLPPEVRIVAQIESHLAAPADQPMRMPNALCLDGSGGIFVADGAQDRIVHFSADGKFVEAFKQIGDKKLSRPIGMRVDAQGQLWIADTGNHRLLVRSADGKNAQEIALPAAPDKKPCDPTDLELSPDGKFCYIVDMTNHRVLKRDNAAGTCKAMGSGGRGLGEFQWPFMLTIGAENYVYVVETIGARLQQISPADQWAGIISSFGVELGQVYRPKGIAADNRGRLFVSDSTLNVIQVFGPRGAVEGALCDENGNLLKFAHPMGLCFDKAGRLYVVELRANCVTVVKLAPPSKGPSPVTGNKGAATQP